MRQFIPDHIFDDLQRHILKGCSKSERKFRSFEEEEDAVTGMFLGELMEDDWQVIKENGNWRGAWRVKVRKFGSKGTGTPLENIVGADGILQIHVFDSQKKTLKRKGLLIQAKNKQQGRTAKNLEQAEKMKRIAPGANAIIKYSPKGFFCQKGEDFIESLQKDVKSINELLADDFLECRIGDENLQFDFESGNLYVPFMPEILTDGRIKKFSVAEIDVQV